MYTDLRRFQSVLRTLGKVFKNPSHEKIPLRGGGTVGQNRQKGEVSISHVTNSILDIILSICVARNVRNRSEHISKLV